MSLWDRRLRRLNTLDWALNTVALALLAGLVLYTFWRAARP